MFVCKAHRANGSTKQIRLPDPHSRTKDLLVEIRRQLNLPGKGQLVNIDDFRSAGFTHITNARGTTIYPRGPEHYRKDIKRRLELEAPRKLNPRDTKEKKLMRRRNIRRPKTLAALRPVAIELTFGERKAERAA